MYLIQQKIFNFPLNFNIFPISSLVPLTWVQRTYERLFKNYTVKGKKEKIEEESTFLFHLSFISFPFLFRFQFAFNFQQGFSTQSGCATLFQFSLRFIYSQNLVVSKCSPLFQAAFMSCSFEIKILPET